MISTYKFAETHCVNTKGNDYFVGDIHGKLKQANALFDHLKLTDDDRVFLVGDLVDRGEDSYNAAHLVYDKNKFAVRGNHEQMLISGIVDKDERQYRLALYNGGQWIFDHDKNDISNLMQALNTLPYIRIVNIKDNKKVIVVHAEITELTFDQLVNSELSHYDKQQLIWGRTIIQHQDDTINNNLPLIICGHTPVTKPVQLGNHLYIDTGAGYNYSLTAVDINNNKYHTIDCKTMEITVNTININIL